jgi:hypothetical protein
VFERIAFYRKSLIVLFYAYLGSRL